MEPVRVKLYGFFSVTKRGYLTQQAIAFALLVLLLIISLALPEPSRRSRPDKNTSAQPSNLGVKPSQPGPARETELPAWVGPLFWLVDNLRWIVLAAFIWFAIETCVVLRRFAQKAALRLAGAESSKPR